MKTRTAFALLSTAAMLAAGACGRSDTASPTAPVEFAGSVGANGAAAGGTGTADAVLTGTISGLTGSCPAVSFTIEGKTIRTNAATSFGDGKCAALANGVKVSVGGTMQVDGSVLAIKVGIAPPPTPAPAVATITGTISGLAGSCPAVSFMLEGKTIKTNAATSFGDGKCPALANGGKVSVAGTVQLDGSVLAIKVGVVPPPTPTPTVVTITGTISGLAGSCPAVSFTLEGKTIKTNTATSFGDGKCAALANGAKVSVAGTVQVDGSVLAIKVGVASPPTTAPTISGAITALSGTCPALTITVGTKIATTSASTVFDGKACAELKVGLQIGIVGTIAPGSTTLVATKVISSK